jgi:hypothetical protein
MKKKLKTKWGINISGESHFLVKVGQEVADGQILARVKEKKINSFDISSFLGKIDVEKLSVLNEKFKNSWVNSGELICMTGGIFPSKICFPMTGSFVGIDEFGILRIEESSDIEKEIKSPVNSRVLKLEEDKISLEFEVQEFKGESLVEGKTWGKGKIKLINEARDLDSSLRGGLLFTNNLSKTFLLKAEVIGVTGIVTNKKTDDELMMDLPVLFLDDSEWKEILSHDGENKSFLLNSRVGRLLMVLE